MTAAVSVQVLTGEAYAVEKVPVPIDGPGASCRVRLQSVTGAQLTQVPVIQDGAVVFRVEVPCEGDETIVLDLEWHAQRGLLATAVGKNVLTLPGDDRYAPPVPWRPVTGNALDLCFLVDGTTLTLVDTSAANGSNCCSMSRRTGRPMSTVAGIRGRHGGLIQLSHHRPRIRDHGIEDVEAADLGPARGVARASGGAPIPSADAGAIAPGVSGSRADARRRFHRRPGRRAAPAKTSAGGPPPNCSSSPETRRDFRRCPAPLADSHVRRHDVDKAAGQLRGRHVEIMTSFTATSRWRHADGDPRQFLDVAGNNTNGSPRAGYSSEARSANAAARRCSPSPRVWRGQRAGTAPRDRRGRDLGIS